MIREEPRHDVRNMKQKTSKQARTIILKAVRANIYLTTKANRDYYSKISH